MVEEKKQNQFEDYKYIVMMLGGSIVISIILIFLIGRPLFSSIKETSRELEDKQQKVEKLEIKLKNLKNLEFKKEELKKQNERVLAALPEDKDISRLFVQFESIFSESESSIISVNESKDSQEEGAQKIVKPVTYQITGNTKSYGALKNALGKIESALRILSVKSIKIDGAGSNLNFSFTVSTYTRGQQ